MKPIEQDTLYVQLDICFESAGGVFAETIKRWIFDDEKVFTAAFDYAGLTQLESRRGYDAAAGYHPRIYRFARPG